ncbi:hypothetical protein C2E23DRAFT_862329 [Lenzites betulinus]|nr:hypothetical protein C2E23DRAFT_862329 [Lenzites betulinus]
MPIRCNQCGIPVSSKKAGNEHARSTGHVWKPGYYCGQWNCDAAFNKNKLLSLHRKTSHVSGATAPGIHNMTSIATQGLSFAPPFVPSFVPPFALPSVPPPKPAPKAPVRTQDAWGFQIQSCSVCGIYRMHSIDVHGHMSDCHSSPAAPDPPPTNLAVSAQDPGPAIFQCAVCWVGFIDDIALLRHMTNVISCKRCAVCFPKTSLTSLDEHYRTSPAHPDPCPSCDRAFESSTQLFGHYDNCTWLSGRTPSAVQPALLPGADKVACGLNQPPAAGGPSAEDGVKVVDSVADFKVASVPPKPGVPVALGVVESKGSVDEKYDDERVFPSTTGVAGEPSTDSNATAEDLATDAEAAGPAANVPALEPSETTDPAPSSISQDGGESFCTAPELIDDLSAEPDSLSGDNWESKRISPQTSPERIVHLRLSGCPPEQPVAPPLTAPTVNRPSEDAKPLSLHCRSCSRPECRDPIVTMCGHIFCRECFLLDLKAWGACAACGHVFLAKLVVDVSGG